MPKPKKDSAFYAAEIREVRAGVTNILVAPIIDALANLDRDDVLAIRDAAQLDLARRSEVASEKQRAERDRLLAELATKGA